MRMLRWSEWVHVHTDSVEWLSATALRWSVAVELSLQRLDNEPDDVSAVYVPLTVFHKDSVARRPVVRDENGTRARTLDIAESNELSVEMLKALTDQVVQNELSTEFGTIVAAPPGVAQLRLDVLRERNPSLPSNVVWFLEILARGHVLFMRLELDPASSADAQGAGDATAEPAAGGAVAGERRRFVTYEYTTRPGRAPVSLRGALGKLGWTATAIDFGLAPGRAATYEVEVTAPADTAISKADLVVKRQGRVVPCTIAGEFLGPGRTRSIRVGVTDAPWDAEAVLTVDLALDWQYPAEVLIAAAFVASVLTIGWWNLDALRSEPDAATTLLLAGPTLFAALVSRVGGAGPAGQFVVAARAVLTLAGLLTFLAAGALVAAEDHSVEETLWAVLTALAWLACLVLSLGVLSPGVAWRANRARKSREDAPRKPPT